MNGWKKNVFLGPESVVGNGQFAATIAGFEGKIDCASTEEGNGRMHPHISRQ